MGLQLKQRGLLRLAQISTTKINSIPRIQSQEQLQSSASGIYYSFLKPVSCESKNCTYG